MSRAENRQYERRAKARAKTMAGRFGMVTDSVSIGRLAATRTPCSCAMCANARSSKLVKGKDRPTLAERRNKGD